ncbi:uncharacterized protein TM35_000101520 [Trypanosoma theileri]|uniref:Uncharacterized protein n=1 Tax=Trypanosoma theileri TaxID=67003 RepID=A0A1X0NYW4_9TRYP|nr:uncharacterized protein TM35_000101520 [Trypanosoma theileri]ORC89884.1 hypothetical protein TM35_000101520 [Trypanosoma theileri]
MSGTPSRKRPLQPLPPITHTKYFGKQSASEERVEGKAGKRVPLVSLPHLYQRAHSKNKNKGHENTEENNTSPPPQHRRLHYDEEEEKEEEEASHRWACVHPLGWAAGHRAEQAAAAGLVLLARSLFHAAVLRPPAALPAADGPTQLRRLAVRAAVAGRLLEAIADALPRHRNTLAPCIALLLREVYVPDTPEMRAALGGTVQYPQLLQDLPQLPEWGEGNSNSNNYNYAITTSNNTTTPMMAADLVAAVEAGTVDAATIPTLLLSRYARKTYFLAHHELTQVVITLAHANAARQQHFKRLPRIFALLNANWIKSFLRITLKAWHDVCHNRRQREQKYRARWARRFAAERIRVAVRLWRVFANMRLQSAAALDTVRARIAALQLSAKSLESEIVELTSKSAELSEELVATNNHRVEVEGRIAEREQEYERRIAQVREIDRVGTRLLDSLLLRTPFPTLDGHNRQNPHHYHREKQQHEWLETPSPLELLVLWANTTLLESPLGSLFLATTDEDFVENIDHVKLDLKQKEQNGQKMRMRLRDTPEEDLPFSALLAEASTVLLPLHRLLALMRAMDPEGGPPLAKLKEVCIADMRIRSLRAKFEDDSVMPEETNTNTAIVVQLEATVGQTLVEAYKAVTGTVCIVTAEQLMTRKRGVQLVFLAGLMRYFANWLECKVKRQRATDDTHPIPIASSAPTAEDQHLGKRNRRCSGWYHPPESHLRWPLMVENQQRWIAASLSALHHAVHIAVEPQTVFSTEVQEDTPKFMENITILRLSDILPQEAFSSGSIYLRIARTVENAFPKLRSLFMQYAVYGSGSGNNKQNNDKAASMSSAGGVGPMYITALDFWRLLRDCRVAGGKGKLHRVAVRRILARVWEEAMPSVASRRGSIQRSMELTSSVLRPSLRPRITGRETTEIDLKDTHYKIRLGPAEFMEALLRCAHAWDNIQQQVRREQEQQKKQQQEEEEKEKEEEDESDNPLKGGKDTDNAGKEKETSTTGTTTTTVVPSVNVSSDSHSRNDPIRYEPFDSTWTLRPVAVREFLYEWIITHGFRGPTLDPFRRAARHVQVRTCLTTHLSALYVLFTYYAKPREAYGMRSAAPDTDVARRRSFGMDRRLSQSRSRVSSVFINEEFEGSQSGYPSGAGASTSNSSVFNNSGTMDVGIARVLALSGLQHMAAEFEWCRIRRVTPRLLADFFSLVSADHVREPHVLFFPEWLDLLCVLAQYYDPNPIRPLYDKLPGFLEEYVLKYYTRDD